MLMNISDYSKHSNLLKNMVKFVQLHGNQEKQQLNQILKNQRHIGKIHMLRIEKSHFISNH